MSNQLKPCPFCGGESWHAYSEKLVGCDACDVWVGYGGAHEAREFEQAVAVWNRRTPEPGTSVIRWTRYDGTPKTLPQGKKRVFAFLPKCDFWKDKVDSNYDIFFFLQDRNGWVHAHHPWGYPHPVRIGDLWAYLPETPEGME